MTIKEVIHIEAERLYAGDLEKLPVDVMLCKGSYTVLCDLVVHEKHFMRASVELNKC